MCGHGRGKHFCKCQGPRMERFIQPCMLLLLYEKPAHGYELMETLKQFGFGEGADPGLVYRNLRKLEEEGSVESEWETEGAGPAKRLYKVTPGGIKQIHVWSSHIRDNMKKLKHFLDRYEQSFNQEHQ